MNYMEMIIEDANILLEDASSSSKRSSNKNTQKIWERIRTGTSSIYGPMFSKKAVDMTKSDILKPYGFKEIDITNKRQLTVVLASIKRRRDIQAAKGLYLGAVGLGIGLVTGALSKGSTSLANDPSVAGSGTVVSDIFGGVGTALNIVSITSLALTTLMEIANAIDVAKATREIKDTRNKIMDAYDKVSFMIQNGKAAGADNKAYNSYHELLTFRDSLREAQVTLTNFGGFGAGKYLDKLSPKASTLTDADKAEIASMNYIFNDGTKKGGSQGGSQGGSGK